MAAASRRGRVFDSDVAWCRWAFEGLLVLEMTDRTFWPQDCPDGHLVFLPLHFLSHCGIARGYSQQCRPSMFPAALPFPPHASSMFS